MGTLMNHALDPVVFETLIHLLEASVVLGIGVIVYITNRHSKNINASIEKRMKDELDISSKE